MARSAAVWQQTRHQLVGRWAQASVTMITHDPGGPVEHWQPSLVGVRPPVPDERRLPIAAFVLPALGASF
jgi:hypothetical protein